MILDRILEAKRDEIDKLHAEFGLSYFHEAIDFMEPVPSFLGALATPYFSLIAEVKRASPSKGIIREDFNPVELAEAFWRLGASALSVLTERDYFLGDPKYITKIRRHVGLPILRKDFILDPIQVYEAKAIGASAILLIQAILEPEDTQSLMEVAADLELDVLLEVHSEEELDMAAGLAGVQILGVNNRDLRTFEIDMGLSGRLYPKIRDYFGKDVIAVTESGYQTVAQLQHARTLGYNAVLVGEGLALCPELLGFFRR